MKIRFDNLIKFVYILSLTPRQGFCAPKPANSMPHRNNACFVILLAQELPTTDFVKILYCPAFQL